MFTITFKGYSIHGFYDSPFVRVQRADQSFLGEYRSTASAKHAITKEVKNAA